MSVNIKQALFPEHEELFPVIDRIDNMDIAELAIYGFQLPAVGTQIPITDKYERDIRFRERLQNQMTIVFRLDPADSTGVCFRPDSEGGEDFALPGKIDRDHGMIPAIGDQNRRLTVSLRDIVADHLIVRNYDIGKLDSDPLRQTEKLAGPFAPLVPPVLQAVDIDDDPLAEQQPIQRQKQTPGNAQNEHDVVPPADSPDQRPDIIRNTLHTVCMQRHVFKPGVFISFQSGRISLATAKNSLIHIFGTTLSDEVFHKGFKTSVFRRNADGSDNCDLLHITVLSK